MSNVYSREPAALVCTAGLARTWKLNGDRGGRGPAVSSRGALPPPAAPLLPSPHLAGTLVRCGPPPGGNGRLRERRGSGAGGRERGGREGGVKRSLRDRITKEGKGSFRKSGSFRMKQVGKYNGEKGCSLRFARVVTCGIRARIPTRLQSREPRSANPEKRAELSGATPLVNSNRTDSVANKA